MDHQVGDLRIKRGSKSETDPLYRVEEIVTLEQNGRIKYYIHWDEGFETQSGAEDFIFKKGYRLVRTKEYWPWRKKD